MTKAAELAKMGEVLTNSQIGGRRNLILNPKMELAQRSTSASFSGSGGGYPSLDRYKTYASGGGALTLSQETDVPSGEGFKNSMKVTVNTNDSSIASGDYYVLQQRIEGNACSQLMQGTANAETITISFYVKSSLTGNFGGALNNSASDRSYPFQYTIDSADTWQRIIKTITLDTSGTWATDTNTGLQFQWDFGSGTTFQGTANAWASANYHTATSSVQLIGTSSATWFVTGFQIEIGSYPNGTPFEHRSLGEELQLCKRYFAKESGSTMRNFTGSTIAVSIPHFFKTNMRAAPTITGTNATALENINANCFGSYKGSIGSGAAWQLTGINADAEL